MNSILLSEKIGGGSMATSSFGKQFTVRREKATDFVAEMTKAVTPTLRSDFQSHFTHLSHEPALKDILGKALNKK